MDKLKITTQHSSMRTYNWPWKYKYLEILVGIWGGVCLNREIERGLHVSKVQKLLSESLPIWKHQDSGCQKVLYEVY